MFEILKNKEQLYTSIKVFMHRDPTLRMFSIIYSLQLFASTYCTTIMQMKLEIVYMSDPNDWGFTPPVGAVLNVKCLLFLWILLFSRNSMHKLKQTSDSK